MKNRKISTCTRLTVSKPTGLEQIELEMAYTPYSAACKDPIVDTTGDLRECRRQNQHAGPHASGHGNGLIMWGRA